MTNKSREACDILILGGDVIDGTGIQRKKADIAIKNDLICEIGDLGYMEAPTIIDARSLIVSPGFIDVHTHDDNLLFRDPGMTSKTSQGVTTVIVGNCGISLAPLVLKNTPPPPPLDLLGNSTDFRFESFADYLQALDANPPATNAAFLVGHSTLRLGVMENVNIPANNIEIENMKILLEEAMNAGATGFSTGLIYGPNKAATTEEIIALAEVTGSNGGIYVTHMRNEGDEINKSLDETFEIGRKANIPVIVSHHKCAGKDNFGRSIETLDRFEVAKINQEVGLDVYPYTAGSTVILAEMVEIAEKVLITWSETRPEFAGCELSEVANSLGCSIQEAAEQLTPGGAIYFMMNEDDVRRIIAYPDSMIGSDGLPHDKHPHPRLWGTFPRVLGYYAREVGLLSLEDAVYKMTGLSAKKFGLHNRGVIRKGAFADITLFNASTVIDKSTFAEPTEPAAGIETVIVNGTIIRDGGKVRQQYPGRALRRTRAFS